MLPNMTIDPIIVSPKVLLGQGSQVSGETLKDESLTYTGDFYGGGNPPPDNL
jgi:hypothetical protein